MMLQKIILWIALLFVLVITIMWIGNVMSAVQLIDPALVSCAEQIKNHARYVELAHKDPVKIIDRSRPPSIACPTQERTYKGSEEQILHAVAQNMKSCYDLWNGGDHILFNTDGLYCHVCTLSTIEHNQPISGLERYLATQPPNKPFLEQMVPGIQGEQIRRQIDSTQTTQAVLEPGVEYATIFYYARGKTALEIFEERISEDSLVKTGIAGTGMVAIYALCTIGAKVCVPGLVIGGVTTAVASWVYETPPEYASSTLFLEWSPQTVERLGCEYSFVERTTRT